MPGGPANVHCVPGEPAAAPVLALARRIGAAPAAWAEQLAGVCPPLASAPQRVRDASLSYCTASYLQAFDLHLCMCLQVVHQESFLRKPFCVGPAANLFPVHV